MRKLSRSFYAKDTKEVAKSLLGKQLVYKVDDIARIGKIVEVEAYLGPHDLACHATKGMTKRTKVMFGPPGHAYVYLIYGLYHCLNVVTEPEGHGSAVLIRALEPLQNITSKTQGPGLLCKAMGIDLSLNGHDLESSHFFIADLSSPPFNIIERPRVGIPYAQHWQHEPLRFYIENNPFISKP